MTAGNDRRYFSRVTFHTWTELTQLDKSWQCQLLDISLKGLLLVEPEGFDVDETQPLLAKVLLSDSAVIEMKVEVVRHQDKQLGLVCKVIDIDSISHLRRMVELNLGDPNAAERELHELMAWNQDQAE
jgi:hypothetical protein